MAAGDVDARGRDKPADQCRGAELSVLISHDRAPVRETPPSCSATGVSTGPDLQLPEDSQHLESPVRTSGSSDPDHLFPTNPNETPTGPKAGGLTLRKRSEKGNRVGERGRGEVTGTPTHLSH